MPSRRADVFFYGLFMDEDVLRAHRALRLKSPGSPGSMVLHFALESARHSFRCSRGEFMDLSCR